MTAVMQKRWMGVSDERALWLATHVMPHEPAVRGWLRRSRQPDFDVDDIIQEAYAKLVTVSDYYDTSATLAGTEDYWVVEDWLTHNLYVQYEFEGGRMEGTRLRIGARNLTNEDPPLANERYGYDGSVHSNRGRWWYATIRKSF